MATLTLIRGLPGSGKSTLAQQIKSATGAKHFEADMYMIESDGVYRFKRDLIKDAHRWCENATRERLGQGFDVVVSNTFTTNAEIFPYLTIGHDQGASVQCIEVTGPWRTIHGVPEEVQKQMRERWEPINPNILEGWVW